jgi:NhaP-type Na+/H+ or K+/H+ antiporter
MPPPDRGESPGSGPIAGKTTGQPSRRKALSYRGQPIDELTNPRPMIVIGIFVSLVFLYSLISARLERTVITAPILFTAAGMLTSLIPAALYHPAIGRKGFLLIAEVGLVMLLFTDASHISLRVLRGNRNVPVRLLSTGMLLTILLGAMGALVVLGGLSLWEAGILAAILAPTDAGLGQVIVSSPRVPMRIRQALNVEAGLNDGLSVPFLMFFIALALRGTGGAGAVLTRFLGEQLGFGILVGLGTGLVGGALLGLADRKGWVAAPLRQLGLVALPLLCVVVSDETGASMFIAAFVAGLAVQIGFPEAGRHGGEFAEDWGQLLNFFVFFLFGLLVAGVWRHFSPAVVLYAILSLTLVRMAPVALALAGTGLSWSTVLFMGWFGPRGLASIVLGLVYLERQAHLPGESTMRLAVMATVLLSIFAHGLSALPGIALYARGVAALDPEAPEHQAIEETIPG